MNVQKKYRKKQNKLIEKLKPLNKALFIESNPGPVKYASSLLEPLSPMR